jgi:hypothetical protein
MDKIQEYIDQQLKRFFARASSIDLSGGGEVPAESLRDFITTSGKEATPLLEKIASNGCMLIQSGEPMDIPTIGIADDQLIEAEEGTEPTDIVEFTNGKAQITTVNGIYPVNIPYSVLEDAIGRNPGEIGEAAANAKFDQLIGDLAMKGVSKDLQHAVINGDTTSGNKTLKMFDGAVKLLTAGGATYTPGAAQTVTEFLTGMYGEIPENFDSPEELTYWLAKDEFNELWEVYKARGTQLGDKALTESMNGGLLYQGIKCKRLVKLAAQKAILAHDKAFWLGMKRRMTVERQRKPRAQMIELTISLRAGHAEVLDACVLGTRTI